MNFRLYRGQQVASEKGWEVQDAGAVGARTCRCDQMRNLIQTIHQMSLKLSEQVAIELSEKEAATEELVTAKDEAVFDAEQQLQASEDIRRSQDHQLAQLEDAMQAGKEMDAEAEKAKIAILKFQHEEQVRSLRLEIDRLTQKKYGWLRI